MAKIDIVVSGNAGAGKSAIVQLVMSTLMARGLTVTSRVDDVRTSEQLTQVLKNIGATTIAIREEQPRRASHVGYQPVPGPMAPPPAPKVQAVEVGQTWYARLKGASTCFTCVVIEMSAKTVLLSSSDGFVRNRYVRSDVNFIELLTPNVSKVVADM